MALYSTGGASILSAEQVAALVVQPLLDQSVAAQISTVVSTSSHNLRIPVVATDPAAAWTAEGAEIAVSDPVLTEVNVTPSKLAGLVVVSNELAADSSPAALQVGDGLVRDLRRKTDAAYFAAATPNGPAGIASLAASTASAGGAWTNLDWSAAAIAAAENLHTAITAFVTSPATALSLSTLKEYTAAASNKPLLQADPTQPVSRTISGVPLYREPERRR